LLQQWGGVTPSVDVFSAAASAMSECGSAKRGGDLGEFGLGKMQPPFEQVAFALQPGAISGVVDTQSGCHLIMRLE
jgi:peptidyl-prolyl cis-trans isomerase NIMA-interacting 1